MHRRAAVKSSLNSQLHVSWAFKACSWRNNSTIWTVSCNMFSRNTCWITTNSTWIVSWKYIFYCRTRKYIWAIRIVCSCLCDGSWGFVEWASTQTRFTIRIFVRSTVWRTVSSDLINFDIIFLKFIVIWNQIPTPIRQRHSSSYSYRFQTSEFHNT